MSSFAYALARAELIRVLTAYSGITTSDGTGTTTLVDSNLIGKDSRKIVEKTILIMSGDADWEDKGALSFDTVTGTITLQGTGFSAQIKAGTIFRILNISSIEIDVANIDTKIGTSADPAGTTTLFAWLVKLFEQGGQGGFYYGKVTQVDNVTHFRVSSLAGTFDDAYFANTYRVYVVRDAAGLGAAPQGEVQPCSGFSGTNAIFTHTAFTVSLAVDDEVLLIHERIAEIKDLIDRLGAFTGTENLKAILGNLSTTKRLGQILGALDETNTLKAILGAYTAAANLKAAIDAVALEATLGTHDTDIKALLATIAGYIDTEIAAIDTKIGTAADAGDLGTLFGRHLRAYLGTHTHALVVVHDTSSLDADLDTALQQWLLDVGFVVTLADPTDVSGYLEAGSFDLVIVSASCVAADAANLANLKQVGAPVICHSADIAADALVFDMGGTPHSHAAQTQIEIINNTPMWLIALATGNLTVTASAAIYAMETKATAAVTLAEEATGTGDHLTAVRLSAGEENEAGYAAFYDRFFVGVGDYTNMNAVWKAVMEELAMHCVMEKRFTEEAIVQVKGVYQEDVPDTDVSDTATTTESECILLDIGPKTNRRYVLRHLRVKAQADPAGDTMTVKLYEYFEGALVNVDTFDVDTANWGTYHSLMDMFGLSEVHSDAIRVACVMDANTLAVKATYCYAEAKK